MPGRGQYSLQRPRHVFRDDGGLRLRRRVHRCGVQRLCVWSLAEHPKHVRPLRRKKREQRGSGGDLQQPRGVQSVRWDVCLPTGMGWGQLRDMRVRFLGQSMLELPTFQRQQQCLQWPWQLRWQWFHQWNGRLQL